MADRPIIFSAPMVRALIEGRKTQTRRILKPQPQALPEGMLCKWHVPGKRVGYNMTDEQMHRLGAMFASYAPGNQLYVREAWRAPLHVDADRPSIIDRGTGVWFEADGPAPAVFGRARPSIHMPRWASRITLTVSDVRVQRLQEISEADAVAEGIERLKSGRGFYDPTVSKALVHGGHYFRKAAHSYEALWNSLHGPEAWDANPWVVAISFTVRQGNIDQ